MKLHSPEFERALRRKVRETVSRSRELRREYRLASKWRRHYSIALAVRFGVCLGFGALVFWLAENAGNIEAPLAVITLWAFIYIFIQAANLIAHLYASNDIHALADLPASEELVFRWQLQKFARSSLWLLGDLLAGYLALAAATDCSALQFLVAFFSCLLTWLEVLALAALCVRYKPGLPYALATPLLYISIMLLFFGRELVGQAVLLVLSRYGSGLNLLLPSGWPSSLMLVAKRNDHWVFLLLLIPIGMVIWSLKASLLHLRSGYRFGEQIKPEAPDLLPGNAATASVAPAETHAEPQRVGLSEISDHIESRSFFAPPPWQNLGWLENWLWRWLENREKALMELAFPNGFSVTHSWKKVLRNMAVAWLGGVLAGFVSLTAEYWTFGLGFFVTVVHVLSLLLVSGSIFTPTHWSGVQMPVYIGYPVGIRELARLFAKISLVQMPLVTLFTVGWSCLVSHLAEIPLLWGVIFGLKAGGLLFFSRFIVVAMTFSSVSNDSSGIRLRSLLILFFIVVLGLMFLILGGASLFVPVQTVAWILWALAAADAYAFFRVYGWFYHRNWFDLMKVPRQ